MTPFRITIHCSASPNGKEYGIQDIRRDHLARGFRDIGYHLVIQPDGTVERGRPLNEVGAHVMGENNGNIGICLVGMDKFTNQQFNSLRNELDTLYRVYQIRFHNIYCHNEWPSAKAHGKTCPNMRAASLMVWYMGHYTDAIEEHILEE